MGYQETLCIQQMYSVRHLYIVSKCTNCSINVCIFQVVPGETALAFYKAKNPTDKPIIGISTYNILPFEAGQYFNKIQVSKHVQEYLYFERKIISFYTHMYIVTQVFQGGNIIKMRYTHICIQLHRYFREDILLK